MNIVKDEEIKECILSFQNEHALVNKPVTYKYVV